MCWLREKLEEKLCPERKWIWQRWWKGLKMDEVAFQHLCDGADLCTALQLNNSWGKAGNRKVLIFGRGSRRGGLARKSIGFLPTDGFDSNGREVLAASFLSQFSHHSRLHSPSCRLHIQTMPLSAAQCPAVIVQLHLVSFDTFAT